MASGTEKATQPIFKVKIKPLQFGVIISDPGGLYLSWTLLTNDHKFGSQAGNTQHRKDWKILEILPFHFLRSSLFAPLEANCFPSSVSFSYPEKDMNAAVPHRDMTPAPGTMTFSASEKGNSILSYHG